jgi:DNA-directed RNA polymerase subunit RPC12/RpoP
MTTTLVVVCSRCGGLLLAKADQKTRACPHCGFTILLQKAMTLATANTANEASIMLRKLKTDAAGKERGFKTS